MLEAFKTLSHPQKRDVYNEMWSEELERSGDYVKYEVNPEDVKRFSTESQELLNERNKKRLQLRRRLFTAITVIAVLFLSQDMYRRHLYREKKRKAEEAQAAVDLSKDFLNSDYK